MDRCKTNVTQSQGIEQTRRQAIPAYTFTGFPNLPCELQLKIWSLATRFEKPRTHFLSDNSFSEIVNHYHENETRVPQVLQVCHQSRVKAQKVLIRFGYGRDAHEFYDPEYPFDSPFSCDSDVSYHSGIRSDPFGGYEDNPDDYVRSEKYVNALYDTFYVGDSSWYRFPLLLDKIIKLNLTPPRRFHHPSVDLEKLDRFRNIRLLAIDLSMFHRLPAEIWTEFTNLESLSLVIYPWIHGTIAGVSQRRFTPYRSKQTIEVKEAHLVQLTLGREDTCSSTVKKMVLKFASDSFEDVKRKLPEWNAPKVQVMLRKLVGQWEEDQSKAREDDATCFRTFLATKSHQGWKDDIQSGSFQE